MKSFNKRENSLTFKKQFDTLKEVFSKYALKVPLTRKLLFPYFYIIVVSRLLFIVEMHFATNLNNVLSKDDKEQKLYNLSLFSLSFLLSNFLSEFISFLFTPSIQRAYRNSSKDAFHEYISLEYSKFSKLGSGEIHASVERKCKAVSDIIDVVVTEFIPMLITFIFFFCALGTKIGFIVPIVMFITFIFFLYVTIEITKKRAEIRKETNKKLNEQSNSLYDTLMNYDSVLAYNNTDIEVERYDRKLQKSEILYNELYRTHFLLNLAQKFIFHYQIFIVALIGIYGGQILRLDSGTFFFYLQSLKIIGNTLNKSGHLYNKYAMGIINYNKSDKIEHSTDENLISLVKFKSNIKFDDVSVFYSNRCILNSINLTIFNGQKIAIVGKNGAGKSTLVKILLGFIDYEGNVFIDSIDFTKYSIKSVRDRISYIHQDSAMFNESIRYNIRYGNTKISDIDLETQCKEIDVHDSIISLKNGYETLAGEKGQNLSGGERQKIAFARAVVKNSDILILDEPTASLDKYAERDVLEKTFETFKNKTILMIVHNLHLLKFFDRIVYIENKVIRECGTFYQLMNNGGNFCRYYNEFYKKD